MAGHPVCDHAVVLDDQDSRHDPTIIRCLVVSGFRNGDGLVKRPFVKREPGDTAPVEPIVFQPSAPEPEPETYDRSFNALRTGFTAAVSHELRTPLARILALLESAELPDANVSVLLEQARAEVENAGALIDEIMFLSELESGKEVVSLGHTTALPVLEEVVEELVPAAARAGVELAAVGDSSVDLPLRPRMLRIVAENLTENAIRYAGHGAHFTLSIERAGDFAILTAADDGVGVQEHSLERIFERFYRGDTARSTRGTGLGLAIVKHVVAAAGGDVEAHGARGRGLRVKATFPS
jgi:two-component system phosphate regulon sensor histidine kinase PhoR